MFCAVRRRMLASMSTTEWSDVGVSELPTGLPTGTVTLLLADVEGSTRLWQTEPDGMTAAVAHLDRAVSLWAQVTPVTSEPARRGS
jgi:class 3 adenylate cyclase